MSDRMTLEDFEVLFEGETGFDLMGKQDEAETDYENARHNIQWLRDWAAETARRMENLAVHLEGSDDDE